MKVETGGVSLLLLLLPLLLVGTLLLRPTAALSDQCDVHPGCSLSHEDVAEEPPVAAASPHLDVTSVVHIPSTPSPQVPPAHPVEGQEPPFTLQAHPARPLAGLMALRPLSPSIRTLPVHPTEGHGPPPTPQPEVVHPGGPLASLMAATSGELLAMREEAADCGEQLREEGEPMRVAGLEVGDLVHVPQLAAFRDIHMFEEKDDIPSYEDEVRSLAAPAATSPDSEQIDPLQESEPEEAAAAEEPWNPDDYLEGGLGVRRQRPPLLQPTLAFPPLPRGELYRVLGLALEEGSFVFSQIAPPVLNLLQPAAYPLEWAREVLAFRRPWLELLTDSLGEDPASVSVLGAGLVLAAGTPLCLLVAGCVGLARRCRSKHEADECGGDGEGEPGACGDCRRCGLNFSMVILLALLAVGVAGTFLANEQVSEGVSRAPAALDTALADCEALVRNSHQQLRFVLTSAADTATEATVTDLDNVQILLGRPLQREMSAETGADAALDLLADISFAAQTVAERSVTLHQTASTARSLAQVTQDKLKELRFLMEGVRRECSPRERPLCDTLDTHGLDVSLRVDQVMNEPRLAKLRRMRDEGGLSNLARQARADFQYIPHRVDADTRETRNAVRREMESRRTALYAATQSLDMLARRLEGHITRARVNVRHVLEPIPNLETWRWALGLATSILLLVLWVFLVVAVSCGCCGAERQAGCVIITSLVVLGALSVALWAVAGASFLLGSRAHMLACRPLREEPDFPALSALLDSHRGPGFFASFAYGNNTLDVPVPAVLAECRDNKPSYTAFRMSSVMDVEQLTSSHFWQPVLDELSRMRVDLRQLVLLTPELQRKLADLHEATSIDLAMIRSKIGSHVTGRELGSFATQVEAVAQQIRDPSIASRLDDIVARSRKIVHDNIDQLQQRKDELVYQLTALEVQMLPLQRQVNYSFVQLKKIQRFVTNQGAAIAIERSGQFSARLTGYVQQLRSHIADSLENTAAPCRPLWNAFHAARTLVCNHLVDPMNGIWLSISWSLIILLMAIPATLSLRAHYDRRRGAGLLARTVDSSQADVPAQAWSNNNSKESGSQDNNNW